MMIALLTHPISIFQKAKTPCLVTQGLYGIHRCNHQRAAMGCQSHSGLLVRTTALSWLSIEYNP